MGQRGFSLIEAVIVAAIVATVAAILFSGSSASQPFGARPATMQFDAALTYARALASAHGSAAIAFSPRSGGGVSIAVAGAPPFEIDASVRDATVGPPPFSIVLNAAGHAAGPGCPAGGWALTFRSGPAEAVRSLACLQ